MTQVLDIRANDAMGGNRRLASAVRLPVFLLLGATLILFALSIAWSAHRSDALAIDRERDFLGRATALEIANVANALSISAYWDDPILRLRDPAPADLAWAHELIGAWLHDRFSHDRLYILDPADRPIYAMRDGQLAEPTDILSSGPAMAALIDEVRGRDRRLSSASRPLTHAYGKAALPDHVADIIVVEGRPAIVVVMKSKPLTTAAKQPLGEELLFVSVVFFDEGFIQQLDQRHGIDHAHFAASGRTQPGEQAQMIVDRSGAPVGYVIWRPALPGPSVIKAMAPIAFVAFVAVLVGLALFVRNLQRISRKMSAGERDLLEALDRAEAASRAKSAFLANMSHEIRTPLNGIVAAADLLAREAVGPKQRELAEMVQGSSAMLTRILSDILDLSRLDAGRLELEETTFHLHPTIGGAAALAQLQAEEKGLRFRFRLNAPPGCRVRGDPIRIKQVLMNLLSNAVKFTEEGEVSLDVVADTEARPPVLKIAVSDTGIGFTKEQSARLFSRFEQADTSITRRYGGSGLGLSISHALVSLMGGRITGSGEAEVGAVFSVELPLRLADPTAASADASVGDGQELEAEEERPLRVLLAEDNPINRRVVELILAAAEVDLKCVENGAEAVEVWESAPIDVILMDMQMPVMDGLAATKAIRAKERELRRLRTPIIFVTANAMSHHAVASQSAGGDLHLSKPLTPQVLLTAIEAVLSQPGEQPLGVAQSAYQ